MDKPLLVRYGFETDAGIYGLAYRIVIVATLPVRAVLQASYATFFRLGKEGLDPALKLARRLLVPALFYSVGVGSGLWLLAPLAQHLLPASPASS